MADYNGTIIRDNWTIKIGAKQGTIVRQGTGGSTRPETGQLYPRGTN